MLSLVEQSDVHWVLSLSDPGSAGCTEYSAWPQDEEGQGATASTQQRTLQTEAEGGRRETEATEGYQEEALSNSGSKRKTKSEV